MERPWYQRPHPIREVARTAPPSTGSAARNSNYRCRTTQNGPANILAGPFPGAFDQPVHTTYTEYTLLLDPITFQPVGEVEVNTGKEPVMLVPLVRL